MCETYHIGENPSCFLYIGGQQGRKYHYSDWRRTTAGLTEAPFGKELGGIYPPASPLFLSFVQ